MRYILILFTFLFFEQPLVAQEAAPTDAVPADTEPDFGDDDFGDDEFGDDFDAPAFGDDDIAEDDEAGTSPTAPGLTALPEGKSPTPTDKKASGSDQGEVAFLEELRKNVKKVSPDVGALGNRWKTQGFLGKGAGGFLGQITQNLGKAKQKDAQSTPQQQAGGGLAGALGGLLSGGAPQQAQGGSAQQSPAGALSGLFGGGGNQGGGGGSPIGGIIGRALGGAKAKKQTTAPKVVTAEADDEDFDDADLDEDFEE